MYKNMCHNCKGKLKQSSTGKISGFWGKIPTSSNSVGALPLDISIEAKISNHFVGKNDFCGILIEWCGKLLQPLGGKQPNQGH